MLKSDINLMLTYQWVNIFKIMFLARLFEPVQMKLVDSVQAVVFNFRMETWYYHSALEKSNYPPLYMYFQYCLASVGNLLWGNIWMNRNFNFNSLNYVRFTVLVADAFLIFGIREIHDCFLKNPKKSSKLKLLWGSPSTVFTFLIMTDIGLFIVDHIHFEYNGICYGILLLSIGKMMKRNYLMGIFWYSILINMNQNFLYITPVYAIYLAKNYLLEDIPINNSRFVEFPAIQPFDRRKFNTRLAKIFSIILIVTGVSFGPFVYLGQTSLVLSKVFPIKSSTCQDYWAPNVWALYNTLDHVLDKYSTQGFFGFIRYLKRGLFFSKGLENYQQVFLPTITPLDTAICIFLFISPCLVKLWKNTRNPFNFVRSVILCSLICYLFGWHIEEKAILMAIIPLSIMAVYIEKDAGTYVILSITGHYALLPLIATPFQFTLKSLLMYFSSLYSIVVLTDLHQVRHGYGGFIYILKIRDNLYLVALVVIFFYEHVLMQKLGHHVKYPSINIMVNSCCCALGIIYCTLKYYVGFMVIDDSVHKRTYY